MISAALGVHGFAQESMRSIRRHVAAHLISGSLLLEEYGIVAPKVDDSDTTKASVREIGGRTVVNLNYGGQLVLRTSYTTRSSSVGSTPQNIEVSTPQEVEAAETLFAMRTSTPTRSRFATPSSAGVHFDEKVHVKAYGRNERSVFRLSVCST